MRRSINNSYIDFDICYDGTVEIEEINVPECDRRQGLGTKLLDLAKEYASENNTTITLIANELDDSIDHDDLLDFYFSNGFEFHPDDSERNYLVY